MDLVILILKSGLCIEILLPADVDSKCGLYAMAWPYQERKDFLSADRAVSLFPWHVMCLLQCNNERQNDRH